MKTMQFFTALLLIYTTITTLNGMENKEKDTNLLPRQEFHRLKNESLRLIAQRYGNVQQSQPFDYYNRLKAFKTHRIYVTRLALRTDMSNYDKLQQVWGDEHWETRKKIITTIIEEEQTHPDTIKQLKCTPLEECIEYCDVPFAAYLLQKGATVPSEILEKASSQEMSSLLHSYARKEYYE
jgi:hypothetical protein